MAYVPVKAGYSGFDILWNGCQGICVGVDTGGCGGRYYDVGESDCYDPPGQACASGA
ncbi:hypothetical protein D3C74_314530 [compost metagenome]